MTYQNVLKPIDEDEGKDKSYSESDDSEEEKSPKKALGSKGQLQDIIKWKTHTKTGAKLSAFMDQGDDDDGSVSGSDEEEKK